MTQPLNYISINNFKSINSLFNLELRNLNILIGSNGSGKSNFISFFRMLENLSRGSLQDFVRYNGGADTLYFGANLKEDISCELIFGENGYRFMLTTTMDGKIVVKSEQTSRKGDWRTYATGIREEARLSDWRGERGISGITGTRNVCGHIYDARAIA